VRTRIRIAVTCLSAFPLAICAGAFLLSPALEAEKPAAKNAPAPEMQDGPQAAATSMADSTNDLTVSVGKSVLVDVTHPIQRVSVGLGDFATASAVTPTEILLNGKTAGETSLIIWEAGGTREFFNVSVRPPSTLTSDRLEGIRRELHTELPGQSVKITTDSGNIFLRGTVKDLGSSDRAVQIASTAGGKVVNLLYVTVPSPDPQILLKVRFASVDRSLSKQLGINLFSTGFGNTIAGVNTGEFSPPGLSLPAGGSSASATLSNELNLFAFFPGLNLGATIEALETKGLVQLLAEPNVLAENGKQASFLAGGQFPFPTVQAGSSGAGTVSIQFKEYGVRLNFLPTITPRGTIRLQVAPEVSSLDFSNAITISGFEVPSIATRKVRTEVELSDGQSFAIGGLLDNRDTETYYKLPILGDIPILGKFFKSMTKTRNNTELIVIVTPEIVSPIPAGSPLPELKYATKFLPPNSGIPMNTPDAKTEANTPAPPAMPVEQLIQSMKPETPMVVDSASGSFGGGSSVATPTAPQ
jgi:pilus assembly protein CpaC